MAEEETIAEKIAEVEDLEQQLFSRRLELRGMIVGQILRLPPSERLALLKKFCSRCGEVECCDRCSCFPKEHE
jgi:hypothetical protein